MSEPPALIGRSPRAGRNIAVRRETGSRSESACAPSEGRVARAGASRSQTVAAEFQDGVIFGREAERKRVAQELHDDINQKLSLVALELDEAQRLLGTTGVLETAQKLRAIRRRVGTIAQDVHRMSHGLHPRAPVQLELVSALRRLCQDFSDRTHIAVDVTTSTASPLLSRDVSVALYRVTQECLTNVVKHSRSRRAQVALTESCGVLELSVSDHGAGFPADVPASTAGLGLVSIRERARRMGGDVQITSARGHGTTVTVRIPLDVTTGTRKSAE